MNKTKSNSTSLQDVWKSNQRRFSNASTHIFDINYDCLRNIFQHLELTSQFSVLQTDPLFLDVILFDVWYQYYESCFDVCKDSSIFQRSAKFQCDFLHMVLSRFPRITRVPSDIFEACMQLAKQSTFENVIELSICNYNKSKCVLDFGDFLKFPNLSTLRLEKVLINLRNGNRLRKAEHISIISSYIIDHEEGEFLENLFSDNLRTFHFTPLPNQSVSADKFRTIAICIRLEELTVSSHYMSNYKCLDAVLNLTNLKKLSLHFFNNFHFSPGDQKVFEDIFDKLAHGQVKCVAALEMYGIPEKGFFRNPHVKQVAMVSWAIDKIFHHKSDGSVEWSSGLRHTIHAFYKLIATSRTLKTLFVGNNVIHSNRQLKDPHFEDDLQMERLRLGYDEIEIINKYGEGGEECAIPAGHSDGFVTFHFHRY